MSSAETFDAIWHDLTPEQMARCHPPTKGSTMANKPAPIDPNPAAPEAPTPAEAAAQPVPPMLPVADPPKSDEASEAAKARARELLEAKLAHSDAHALEMRLGEELEIAQRRYQRAQQQTAELLGRRLQLEQQG